MRLRWLLLAVGLVAGCGDDGSSASRDSPEPEARAEASTTTSTVAPSSTTAPPPPDLTSVRTRLTEVASFASPVGIAIRPGFEELFVAERQGFVRVLRGTTVLPEPIVDISGGTTADGERGFLGLAFSPDGARLYLSYTDNAGDSILDELSMGAGATDVDLASRRQVLRVDQPFPNHNGGNILFGPDGLLYFGLGDGGGGGDPGQRAQDTEELLGKILRIDPRPSGADPYAIPADNPFASGGGRGEIYVYGVRNPWRFSFDRATGDLWIGDVGQNEFEEIDLLPAGSIAGANLGWDHLEGTSSFEGSPPPDAVPPVFEYGRDEGFSVTGGYVYRGEAIPGLQGAYVFGDYGAGQLLALGVEGGMVTERHPLGPELGPRSLVSFAEGTDGELLVVSLTGPVYRLETA